jgi:hypothetical protein
MDYKTPINPKDVDASEARTRRELVELLSLRSNSRRRTVGEQHKLKDGALGFVRGNPQPAIMGLNDRTADRQTHPHTARFCSEQRIEYPLELLRADSCPVSATDTITPPPSWTSDLTQSTRDPSLAAIESIAFVIKFRVSIR